MILKNYIRNPFKFAFLSLNQHGCLKWLPDKFFLKLMYRFIFGCSLNLDNPKTYNEKLQWLKLYNRRSEYTKMVDKLQAKIYVAEKIGEKHIIPTLGVWNSFDDIDFDSLPSKFVLKCSHDSGGLVLCSDKKKFDKISAKTVISRSLKRNYYYVGREWPYKNIKPCIIAEQYMEDDAGTALTDYKFFCFNGEPKIMYWSKDKASEPRTDFFDMDYNHINMRMRDPNADEVPTKPALFELMKHYARLLSKDIPHVRVDFYEIKGNVYFGELTFFHCSGFAPISPFKMAEKMGEWIDLPQKVK